MKNIIIEYYLITLVIFLINSVKVTEQDPPLQYIWHKLNLCVAKAKVGKNGETLTSTSEILANIDYKSQTHFFDLLFGKMVAATAREHQPWTKCVINQCLSDIKESSLDSTNRTFNAALVKDVHNQEEMIDKIEENQYYYAELFISHIIRFGEDTLWKMLNINSFCAALACIGDIVGAGFIHQFGYENVQVYEQYNNNTAQSDLVREYTNHLKNVSDDIKRNNFIFDIFKFRYRNADQFCTKKTCLHELWSVGFKSELNGYDNLEIYLYNKDTIDNLNYLAYVDEYIIQLLSKNGWSMYQLHKHKK